MRNKIKYIYFFINFFIFYKYIKKKIALTINDRQLRAFYDPLGLPAFCDAPPPSFIR